MTANETCQVYRAVPEDNIVLLLIFRAALLYMVSVHFLMSLVYDVMLPKCLSCIQGSHFDDVMVMYSAALHVVFLGTCSEYTSSVLHDGVYTCVCACLCIETCTIRLCLGTSLCCSPSVPSSAATTQRSASKTTLCWPLPPCCT